MLAARSRGRGSGRWWATARASAGRVGQRLGDGRDFVLETPGRRRPGASSSTRRAGPTARRRRRPRRRRWPSGFVGDSSTAPAAWTQPSPRALPADAGGAARARRAPWASRIDRCLCSPRWAAGHPLGDLRKTASGRTRAARATPARRKRRRPRRDDARPRRAALGRPCTVDAESAGAGRRRLEGASRPCSRACGAGVPRLTPRRRPQPRPPGQAALRREGPLAVNAGHEAANLRPTSPDRPRAYLLSALATAANRAAPGPRRRTPCSALLARPRRAGDHPEDDGLWSARSFSIDRTHALEAQATSSPPTWAVGSLGARAAIRRHGGGTGQSLYSFSLRFAAAPSRAELETRSRLLGERVPGRERRFLALGSSGPGKRQGVTVVRRRRQRAHLQVLALDDQTVRCARRADRPLRALNSLRPRDASSPAHSSAASRPLFPGPPPLRGGDSLAARSRLLARVRAGRRAGAPGRPPSTPPTPPASLQARSRLRHRELFLGQVGAGSATTS